VNIPGATDRILVLENVQPGNAGNYVVFVSTTVASLALDLSL